MPEPRPRLTRKELAPLVLGALGVVYGDIGTSPLYTLKECFGPLSGLKPGAAEVLGILSLIFWALILVVTVKYVTFMLRADNRGEGGTLALMALVAERSRRGRRRLVLLLGMLGAALFFGDALLTPAISVLSAVEGLKVAAPVLERWIVPLAVAVLALLFAVQRHGTERVGVLFGPVVLVWFSVLGVLGLLSAIETPAVFAAISPVHAMRFLLDHGGVAFIALGAVVLAITGAEALYADLGHFGRRAIRIAWLGIVLPGLVLNYFGQGALLLRDPAAVQNPFYLLTPSWALYPMIVLATLATVIASQAVISGAFSFCRQAILLGFLPRLTVRHTSSREMGQIYMPQVNAMLFVGVLFLVLEFQSSSALAAAYGVAITGLMVIDLILAYMFVRRFWGWSRLATLALLAVFAVIDFAFFGATLTKLDEGGWLPMVFAAFVFVVMQTWVRERAIAQAQIEAEAFPLVDFVAQVQAHKPGGERSARFVRVPGTAVFLSGHPKAVPNALLHNLKHNHVLHETVFVLRVETRDRPWVRLADRVEMEKLGSGFYRVCARYGFMQQPNVPAVIEECAARTHSSYEPMATSYFFGRDKFVPRKRGRVTQWREWLFIFLQRNAVSVADFFQIPANRTVELGTQIEI
jgi:KUP system potassium uptake protein